MTINPPCLGWQADLATTGKHFWPMFQRLFRMLVSGPVIFYQNGERVQQVRGIPRLLVASHLA